MARLTWVAPLAGAWIEMYNDTCTQSVIGKSLPLRERGLKFLTIPGACTLQFVAPLAGAWIEIWGKG